MSRTSRLLKWIDDNLDERGWIDRWIVQAKGREFGLPTTVHLYGSPVPAMEQVPGTPYARFTRDGVCRARRA